MSTRLVVILAAVTVAVAFASTRVPVGLIIEPAPCASCDDTPAVVFAVIIPSILLVARVPFGSILNICTSSNQTYGGLLAVIFTL